MRWLIFQLQCLQSLRKMADFSIVRYRYEADERLVAEFNGYGSWWWLRSHGLIRRDAAFVHRDGAAYLYSDYVGNPSGGVRLALWLDT